MLDYQLIRSKRRKTLALQVKEGKVTVRAPYYLPATTIDVFIKDKSAWLLTKIAEHQTRPQRFDFTQGSRLLFLGEHFMLNIFLAHKPSVFINNSLLSETDSFDDSKPSLRQLNVIISNKTHDKLIDPLAKAKQVKKQLEKYFKQQAEQLIIERLECISQQTSLIPKKINIRQYQARWGSCNNRGEVSFNYLLIMTPIFVIDYVIVHELCHLVHLNHSKDFWLLVEKHCPTFKVAKEWLNTHQSELSWKKPS